jgi:ABC-type sugar transport system ATPase subunit
MCRFEQSSGATQFIAELFEVCDYLTIMRDGRTVETCAVSKTNHDAVVAAMVGFVADRQRRLVCPENNGESVFAIQKGTIARR